MSSSKQLRQFGAEHLGCGACSCSCQTDHKMSAGPPCTSSLPALSSTTHPIAKNFVHCTRLPLPPLKSPALCRVYKNYDPRATVIRKVAEDVFAVQGRDPLIDVAVELERVARSDDYFKSRSLYPNVDFYSGACSILKCHRGSVHRCLTSTAWHGNGAEVSGCQRMLAQPL